MIQHDTSDWGYSDRDWKEDLPYENGDYLILCRDCNKRFHGHKLRFQCYICGNKPVVTDKPGLANPVKTILLVIGLLILLCTIGSFIIRVIYLVLRTP